MLPFCSHSEGKAAKNVWFEESPEYLGFLGRPTAISTQSDGAGYRTNMLRRLLIGADRNTVSVIADSLFSCVFAGLDELIQVCLLLHTCFRTRLFVAVMQHFKFRMRFPSNADGAL